MLTHLVFLHQRGYGTLDSEKCEASTDYTIPTSSNRLIILWSIDRTREESLRNYKQIEKVSKAEFGSYEVQSLLPSLPFVKVDKYQFSLKRRHMPPVIVFVGQHILYTISG